MVLSLRDCCNYDVLTICSSQDAHNTHTQMQNNTAGAGSPGCCADSDRCLAISPTTGQCRSEGPLSAAVAQPYLQERQQPVQLVLFTEVGRFKRKWSICVYIAYTCMCACTCIAAFVCGRLRAPCLACCSTSLGEQKLCQWQTDQHPHPYSHPPSLSLPQL